MGENHTQPADTVRRFKCKRCGDEFDWALDLAAHDFCRNRQQSDGSKGRMNAEDMCRFAYADPPYPGYGRYYDGGREVNHGLLVQWLCDEYDGWALSTASTTLQFVLALCPDDVRIAAWVKPFASFKRGVNPAYAWEPVVFRPADRKHDVSQPTTRDWLSASITTRRGFVGAKPAQLFQWVRCLLRMWPDEELDDLFPGSGAGERSLAQGVLL